MQRWALLAITGLLVSGCVESSPAPNDGPDPLPVGPEVLANGTYVNYTGLASMVPGNSRGMAGVIEVPVNTGRITATLLWADPVAELRFNLVTSAPGTHQGGSYDAPGAGKVVADIPDPAIGNWTFDIIAENAVNVDWTLVVYLAPGDGITNVLAEQYVLPSGAFFEINTEMPLNGTMHWDWHIVEGADSDFNLHTHFDGEVQYLVQETTDAHAGSVTAERAGGYSLMWENNGPPQTIAYRVWGEFTVDSYFPPR